uniref:Uncharacterized protein n=1 Tax=Medicago truncatula TaxID=3880 RepID=I3SK64_MEDTR|nr:unknown [Medicago truncatula]
MLKKQLKWFLRTTMIVLEKRRQLLACQSNPLIIFMFRPQSSGSKVRMFRRRQGNQGLFDGFNIVVLTGMSLAS